MKKILYLTTALVMGLVIFANSSWAITAEALDNGHLTANADLFEPPDRPFINLTLTMPQEGNVLALENFAVTEDGRAQVIRDFIPPESSEGAVRPVDIVFVLDDSGSMEPEANQVKANIENFLEELFANSISPRIGLVPFGGNGFPPDGFSPPEGRILNNGNLYHDGESLISDINKMHFKSGIGWEKALSAMQLTVRDIRWRASTQKVLILITDEGCHGEPKNCEGEPTQSELIEELQREGVIVYALTNPEDDEEYEQIALETGGKQFDMIENSSGTIEIEDFRPILEEIGANLSAQYIFQYATDNLAQDGKLRTVELTVNANDDQSNSLQKTFTATYRAYAPLKTTLTPETKRLATTAQNEFSPIEIVAEIDRPGTTNSSVTAFCFYAGSGQVFQSVLMTPLENNLYQAMIPGEAVVRPFVSYYIQARDDLSSRIFTLPSEGSNQPFKISVLPNDPPLITHTPMTLVSTGQDAVISASVADTTNNVKQVTLYYRRVGRVVYESVSMNGNSQTDVQFTATIPGKAITANGLEYYIAAADDLGATTTSGTLDNPIEPTINRGPNITHTPVGSIQEGENLVISAKVVDTQNVVTRITLYYKEPRDSVYQPIAIDYNQSEVDFTATIPGNEVTKRDVQYYIIAEDDLGATGSFRTSNKPIKVSVRSSSSSGGGCALSQNADFDPILLILLILSLGYLVSCRYRNKRVA